MQAQQAAPRLRPPGSSARSTAGCDRNSGGYQGCNWAYSPASGLLFVVRSLLGGETVNDDVEIPLELGLVTSGHGVALCAWTPRR